MILLILFSLIPILSGYLIVMNFLYFLFAGRGFISHTLSTITELVSVGTMPFLYLMFNYSNQNNCCGDSALLSPDHRLSIYCLIGMCTAAYFYSTFRQKITAPIPELLGNCLLLTGIALNILIAIQINNPFVWVLGNVPIICAFILALSKNHLLFMDHIKAGGIVISNDLERAASYILMMSPVKKFPLLLVICLPVLTIIAGLLLIFGQKPDSFIQAFTDTYKQGLSQHDCTNANCPDGHFLCTIAASGHADFVKPIRYGVRHGYQIKANRQLLISNAFEELLEHRLPALHKPIRKTYNLIGGNFRKLYDILGNKWIAHIIYVWMKPLEWLFLLILYTFDRQPENRIAKQYLDVVHRRELDKCS